MNRTSGSSIKHDETGQKRGRAPAQLQDGERHQGKDQDPADGLPRLDDGHGEPTLAAKPVIDRGHGGLVEAGLKAQGQGPDEHQDEDEIALVKESSMNPSPASVVPTTSITRTSNRSMR